jgi:hypothetical protein
LPFAEFVEMQRAIDEERTEEIKRHKIYAGYGSWLMGAGGKKTFKKFCEDYGLIEKVVLTEEQKLEEKNRTATVAAEIIAADRAAHNGKNSI